MNARVDDFDVLRERFHLRGVIITHTACHFGGGTGDVDIVDSAVIKTANGAPYIPGSSLKGVVRTVLESLVGEEDHRDSLWACDLFAKKGSNKGACGDQKKRSDPLKKHCSICALLGSHLVASHVRFGDAHMETMPNAVIEMRDGVAIEREYRTAADQRKYNLEVIAPHTRFSFEIVAQNLPPWAMGLLLTGFESINDGFTALGGRTTRGLGRVMIEWLHMTRVSARDLLDGNPPEELDIASQCEAWREALLQKTKDAPMKGTCLEETTHV